MGQYNRESGTQGRNQFGITSDDMRDLREQQRKILDIELKQGTNDRRYAVIKNFPGLDAEMNEFELRRMADQLITTANKLKELNNTGG